MSWSSVLLGGEILGGYNPIEWKSGCSYGYGVVLYSLLIMIKLF